MVQPALCPENRSWAILEARKSRCCPIFRRSMFFANSEAGCWHRRDERAATVATRELQRHLPQPSRANGPRLRDLPMDFSRRRA